MRAEVHRLVVVDENRKVIGIISLSDILLYLVLRPSGEGMGGSESSLRATDPILQRKLSDDDLDTKSPSVGSGSRSLIEDIPEEEVIAVSAKTEDDVDNKEDNVSQIVVEQGVKSSNDFSNQAEISFADEAEEDPTAAVNNSPEENGKGEVDDDEEDDADDDDDVISGNCDSLKKSTTNSSPDEPQQPNNTTDLETAVSAASALTQTTAREMTLVSE